jgi:hypothetical protein
MEKRKNRYGGVKIESDAKPPPTTTTPKQKVQHITYPSYSDKASNDSICCRKYGAAEDAVSLPHACVQKARQALTSSRTKPNDVVEASRPFTNRRRLSLRRCESGRNASANEVERGGMWLRRRVAAAWRDGRGRERQMRMWGWQRAFCMQLFLVAGAGWP